MLGFSTSLLFTSLLLTTAPAQDPAPKLYLGREIAQTMHWMGASWLIRHKRDQEEASVEMREQLMLKPGMVACDMGSGNGYHTIPMAKAVAPNGKVFASEIQQEMLTMLDERAKKEGINNIVPVLGTQTDAKLPDSSCDLILLVDVYHEFSDPEPMLTAMKKALKPGGQIVLVEFRAEDESVPIKPEHKMSKEQIMKEMTANGLRLSRSYDKLPWQHMLWFEAGQADAAPINNTPASKP
jgi:ubiquinone/menaquinone biosynthesis C-methylase UbiE